MNIDLIAMNTRSMLTGYSLINWITIKLDYILFNFGHVAFKNFSH